MAANLILGIGIVIIGMLQIGSFTMIHRTQKRGGRSAHSTLYLIADRVLILSIGVLLMACGALILIGILPPATGVLGTIFLFSGISSAYQYFRDYPFQWTSQFVEIITPEDHIRSGFKWRSGCAAGTALVAGVLLLVSAFLGH